MPDETLITEEQYQEARAKRDAADAIVQAYFRQEQRRGKERNSSGKPFEASELKYAAVARCPCGHGLAYPDNLGASYWDCAGVLMGLVDLNVQHTDKLPFAFYSVKSESAERGTTRGAIIPKPQ